jgi:tetratricopeptide (TPR) repeat protein
LRPALPTLDYTRRVREARQKRRAEQKPIPAPAAKNRNALWICLALIAANLIVYVRTWGYGFVTWDDPQYITENPFLRQGLSFSGIWWAITTTYQFYWHPLTWISYLADYQFFGDSPGGYHAVNVILHIASTVILFVVLREMSGVLWRSAFVAMLFAVHPLHVESVAWVAERKDVLSTLFWMLTMWAYVRYARRPSPMRYGAVALLFGAGLMAKPMLVTLPFALLLLDAWPLGRLAERWKLVWEKLPLFALSLAASVITFLAQRGAGAVAGLDALPLSSRAANGLVSYVAYLVKTAWPVDLGALYPFLPVPAWKVFGSVVVLLIISAAVYQNARRYAYLAVGWLWYLGTLVPVIGLVQVGGVAMADRFTYIPHVGLFLAITWGLADLASAWSIPRTGLAAAAGSVILASLAAASRQAEYWRDSIALWEHTLQITQANYRAHNNLGTELRGQRRFADAEVQFRNALAIRTDFAEGHNNLGGVLAEQGKLPEAVQHYNEALRLKPDYAEAHNNLGVAYANQGQTDYAIREFLDSLRINPNQADTHSNLAVMYETQGAIPKAVEHFNKALQLNPQHAEARRSLDHLSKRTP